MWVFFTVFIIHYYYSGRELPEYANVWAIGTNMKKNLAGHLEKICWFELYHINFFFFFWPHRVFVAARRLSLVAVWSSHCGDFSSCGARALGS